MSEDGNGTGRGKGTGVGSNLSWNQAVVVGGLALSIPGMLFGPPLVGYWLDGKLGTGPWLFLVGLGVGFVGTAFDVYLILKRSKMLGD